MKVHQFIYYLFVLFILSCSKDESKLPLCVIGDVYVSEAHTSGDPEDYIEIYNSSNEDCLLSNFMLDDSPLLEDFTFGDVVIASQRFWVGYEDFANSFSSGLNSNGDMIYFSDGLSTMELQLGPSIGDLSQSFEKNGERCYTEPTPGDINSQCSDLSF